MRQQTAVVKNGLEPGKKSAATREKLLNAAEALFIERGFDGVSISDITKKAEVNKGLIYYYFKSKRDLFDSVLDRYFAFMNQLVASCISSKGTPREQSHAFIDAYLDFVEEYPGFPRLVQREVCSSPEHTKTVTKFNEPIYFMGKAVFGALLPEDGPLSARQFFVSFFGMTVNYYTYASVLEGLWRENPMSQEALAERREHLHLMLDMVIDNIVKNPRAG